jgi:hypothetical protein
MPRVDAWVVRLCLLFVCAATVRGQDDCTTTDVPEFTATGWHLASIIIVAVLIAVAILLMSLHLTDNLTRQQRLTGVAMGGVVIDLFVGILLLTSFHFAHSQDVITLCGRPSCGSTVLHDMAFYVGVNIVLYVLVEVGVSGTFVYITYEQTGRDDTSMLLEVLMQVAQVVAAFVLTFSFLPMAMPLLMIPPNESCVAVNNFFYVMHYEKVHAIMALVTAVLTILGLIAPIALKFGLKADSSYKEMLPFCMGPAAISLVVTFGGGFVMGAMSLHATVDVAWLLVPTLWVGSISRIAVFTFEYLTVAFFLLVAMLVERCATNQNAAYNCVGVILERFGRRGDGKVHPAPATASPPVILPYH